MNYSAMWIDDDWSSTGRKPQRDFLDDVLAQWNLVGQKSGLNITWSKPEDPANASVELDSPDNDFRLIILDYKFIGYGYSVSSILDKIRSKNIPYIVFSYFTVDFLALREAQRVDPLRLAVLPKDASGVVTLIEMVRKFFVAPPFRMLHLTDLHFDSSLRDDEKEEQEEMFSSLIRELKENHQKTPFDALLITGDFANRDPHEDLIGVRTCIKDIVNETITEKNLDRLFIVPGNHDMLWKNFEKKETSDRPWSDFLDFLHASFTSEPNLLRAMEAWDSKRSLFKLESQNEALSWCRRLQSPQLNVIGLCSPSIDSKNQGKGIFTRDQEHFVKEKWKAPRIFGEVRISMMHHNVFASLSANRLDEQQVSMNPGAALQTLIQGHCSVLLTGHAHSPNIFQFAGNKLGPEGYEVSGRIVCVASGNAGGHHKALDRSRSFNILDFLNAQDELGARTVMVKPWIYVGVDHVWKGCKEASVVVS